MQDEELWLVFDNVEYIGGMVMKPSHESKRNYLFIFSALFVLGIVLVLQSYSINMSILRDFVGSFDQVRVILGCISWIAVGSILSLISGFAMVNLLTKDVH